MAASASKDYGEMGSKPSQYKRIFNHQTSITERALQQDKQASARQNERANVLMK
jgi:hypothetical protein